MKAYKGFNRNLQCDPTGKNPYQYEIGKEYEEEKASVCDSGFHACKNALDVLNYYGPGDSRYCEVDLDGDVSKPIAEDTKIAASKIKIGMEIGIKGIIEAGIRFIFDRAEKEDEAHAATTGYEAHAATTGNWAHAATMGYRAHAATTGNATCASVSGQNSIAASLGANSAVKGETGSWLVCAEWQLDENESLTVVGVVSAKVDGKTILPDVWYTAKDGKLEAKKC